MGRLSSTARLRRRYLLAMGITACTPATPLVSAPLYEGDAAMLVASASDAGRLPAPTSSGPKLVVSDPPEPLPPNWPHSENRICRDDLDPPSRPELPSPFDVCPKRGPSGGQFSVSLYWPHSTVKGRSTV